MRLLATLDECGGLLIPSARRSDHLRKRIGVLGCIAAPLSSFDAFVAALAQIKREFVLGSGELKSSAASNEVTRAVCREIARMAGLVGIAAWTDARVVYDPEWLRPNARHIWCDAAGNVKDARVYRLCYQEVLQKLVKYAEEVEADEIEVLIDHHQCLDKKHKPGWNDLQEAHDWLVSRGESWGLSLSPIVVPHPVSVPSEKDPRLTPVDFFAGAVHKWVCGEPQACSRALVDIVRSHDGKVARYGLIAVPKALKDRFTEEDCQALLDRARRA